jgi:hypothetical protein
LARGKTGAKLRWKHRVERSVQPYWWEMDGGAAGGVRHVRVMSRASAGDGSRRIRAATLAPGPRRPFPPVSIIPPQRRKKPVVPPGQPP